MANAGIQIRDIFSEVISWHREHYNRFRETVAIDRERLDNELLEQPFLLLEVQEKLVEVQYKVSRAKKLLVSLESDLMEHEASSHDRRPGVDALKRMIASNSKFVRATERIDFLLKVEGCWSALRVAIGERGSALRHLSGLLQNNQFPDVGITSGSLRGRRNARDS